MKCLQANIVKKLLFCLILLFFALMNVSVTHAETYNFVTKWGSEGSSDGSFYQPHDVAVDSSGNVYVADNNRIHKFDSKGNFITKWGSYGTGDGQFRSPRCIDVDSAGNVYLTDGGNSRIQKFYGSGTFITTWGSAGEKGDGQFTSPRGIAVDSSGNVYVADASNQCILKFDSSGMYITKWGIQGSSNGQFNWPYGVAIDSSGNIYVADDNNNRIQKFSSSGDFITKWGSFGSSDGQFYSPRGIAIDSAGNVYVADENNNRIQKFSSNGDFITKWGSKGTGNGQFTSPRGIAVDSAGNIYVADVNNQRIQKFVLYSDTITSITSSANPSVSGQSVTLTAKVSTPFSGAGTPSGTVTFFDGNTLLGNAPLSSGQATFTTTSLSDGSHSIKAQYNGASNFNNSTSKTLTLVIEPSLEHVNVSMSSNPRSVGSKNLSTITVTVTGEGGKGIFGASVRLETDSGKINPELGITDSSGKFTSIFTASDKGTATIKAQVTNEGFNEASGETSVEVKSLVPPTPNVSVSSEPESVERDKPSTVTVTVIGTDGKGISGASVKLETNLGEINPALGTTDSSGKFTSIFTASDKGKATIKAQVTKEGFNNASGETSNEVNLLPPITPNVSIFSEPESIEPDKPSTVTVTVTGTDGKGISGTSVKLETDAGKVDPASGTTDSSGKFTSTFYSSGTGTATIKAQVTKEGFNNASGETSVKVKGGSFPIIPLAAILLLVLIGALLYTKRPKPTPEPTPTPAKLPVEAALDLQIEPASIPADGKSTAKLVIKIKDDKGNFVSSINEKTVELSITLGTITSQVKIPSGAKEGIAVITSGEIAGAATVIASSSPLKEVNAQVNFVSR